ncbi:hypothetical protein CDD83_2715 [Cordyceps sp. RAO-2017]|nr:hypothetical protein CDD83_2715 [Cordyceps sp. RAO-2017]
MHLRRIIASALPLGLAAGQVQTKCNPLQSDCPPDPAFGADHVFDFTSGPLSDVWETTAGHVSLDKTGAAFTIAKEGDSPTIRTKFYIFFGRIEIWLRVAPGQGIISSAMLLSDDLDEIDWEFMGSNKSFATTNYFSKGILDYHNGGAHPMTGMQDEYHNYTLDWSKDELSWYINQNKVRSLKAVDANQTRSYPQTPARLSLGIWAGGSPDNAPGVRQWAGGDTDYSQSYTMYVQKVQISDYNSGREYSYGDHSGSWQSIKIEGGDSEAKQQLNREPEMSMSDRFNGLSRGAKTGIITPSSAPPPSATRWSSSKARGPTRTPAAPSAAA